MSEITAVQLHQQGDDRQRKQFAILVGCIGIGLFAVLALALLVRATVMTNTNRVADLEAERLRDAEVLSALASELAAARQADTEQRLLVRGLQDQVTALGGTPLQSPTTPRSADGPASTPPGAPQSGAGATAPPAAAPGSPSTTPPRSVPPRPQPQPAPRPSSPPSSPEPPPSVPEQVYEDLRRVVPILPPSLLPRLP